MSDIREPARAAVRTLLDALVDGQPTAMARACDPRVSWWTPLDDEVHGPQQVEDALRALLGRRGFLIEVRAVAVAHHGRTAVVELSGRRADGWAVEVPITSVLTISGGLITRGRTYVDPEQIDSVGGAT